MSPHPVAAVVYADGIYPDREIARAIEPLREAGMALAGALQRAASDLPGRHPCDLLLENLATGDVVAIAEHRGRESRGCRLDVGILTGIAEAVARSLDDGAPRLLIVNKFGKVEADGGGLREAIAQAVSSDIPVLVGVPARNLDRWRVFAGPLAVELPAEPAAIVNWLEECGVTATGGAAKSPARRAWAKDGALEAIESRLWEATEGGNRCE